MRPCFFKEKGPFQTALGLFVIQDSPEMQVHAHVHADARGTYADVIDGSQNGPIFSSLKRLFPATGL